MALVEYRSLAFENRNLYFMELGYTTNEKAMWAIVHALPTWLCYADDSEIAMVTNYNPQVLFHALQHLLCIQMQ